jgi:tetratricopeptide (TPR) repeat protein
VARACILRVAVDWGIPIWYQTGKSKKAGIVMIKRLCFLMVFVLSLFGCRNTTADHAAELESAMNSAHNGQELISSLLSLDQKYPGAVDIKAHLGIAHLMNGDIESSRIFLVSAEDLVRKSTDQEIVYLIFAGLADVYSKQEDYESSFAYAEKALDMKVQDSLGVLILKARAAAFLGKKEMSLSLYTKAFADFREYFSAGDYALYLEYLAENGAWHEATEVLLGKINSVGYSSGDGLRLSALYEKDSRYIKSLTAASFDLWLLLSKGEISSEDFSARLDTVNSEVQNILDSADLSQFSTVLTAFKDISNDAWSEARKTFEEYTFDTGNVFEQFFFYSATIHSTEEFALSDLQKYVALESSFRSVQTFYRNLWQAMKEGSGNYSFETVRDVLEKTILLGPDTSLAQDSKLELGRLLGISEEESSFLIPRSIVLAILNGYFSSGNEEQLQPITDLLSITNNEYTSECAALLKKYRNTRTLRDALRSRKGMNDSLYLLRLNDIFG